MRTTRMILTSLLWATVVTATFAQEAKVEIKQDNNKIVIKNRSGLTSFDVEVRGKIELTDDDKDIKSMSSDGYLEIKKTVFGSRRTLIVSPNAGGLLKEYYEGRTKIPFDPAGKEWMAEILPELVRSTTIGSESRVDRFFKKGGTSAVLNEIRNLQSNHVQSHYASLLMAQKVSVKDYPRIVNDMADIMDSDYYLASFLKKNMDKFIKSSEGLDAVFKATGNIDSDYYRTVVIKSGLNAQPISIESVKIILNSASRMDSDHYKSDVLTSLLSQSNLTDGVVGEMINTTKSIDSDHYRTVVLNKALAKEGLSSTSFQLALESIKDIDSDYYKSSVLGSLLDKPIPQELQLTLIGLTNSIDSDHYCTQVLQEILNRQKITDQVFGELIQRASSIGSDHYASEVMKKALNSNLSEGNLISLLNASGRIGSDHYLSEVLITAIPKVRNSGDKVRDAFNNAARQIGSETYYGRVMRALN